jgi:hypothetical protein
MSEWFNVLVLKTNVAQVTVGSNPTLSENKHKRVIKDSKNVRLLLKEQSFFLEGAWFFDLFILIRYNKNASSSLNLI